MTTDTKRLGTDLATLIEKHGPTTLRSELAKLVEAQGPGGYVMGHALLSLLDRFPEPTRKSGYLPIKDRTHALRVLQDLALWGRIPTDKELPSAIERATEYRHPDSPTGSLASYLRLHEVIDALGGTA